VGGVDNGVRRESDNAPEGPWEKIRQVVGQMGVSMIFEKFLHERSQEVEQAAYTSLPFVRLPVMISEAMTQN